MPTRGHYKQRFTQNAILQSMWPFRKRRPRAPRKIMKKVIVGLIIGGAIGSIIGKRLMDQNEDEDRDDND